MLSKLAKSRLKVPPFVRQLAVQLANTAAHAAVFSFVGSQVTNYVNTKYRKKTRVSDSED